LKNILLDTTFINNKISFLAKDICNLNETNSELLNKIEKLKNEKNEITKHYLTINETIEAKNDNIKNLKVQLTNVENNIYNVTKQCKVLKIKIENVLDNMNDSILNIQKTKK